MANRESSAGLLPSTISQWLPKIGSLTPSEDQELTGGTVPTVNTEARPTSYNQTLTSRPREQSPLIASEMRSGFTAEAPSSVPEAIPSAKSDVVTKAASGPTDPTKPPPVATTSTSHNAPFSTDPEKVSSSTIPALNEKGTPTSSHLEKEIDLEAGHRSEDSKKQEPETTKQELDTNIVDWDGPDDPQKPVNWPEKLKWANVAVIAAITFLT